MTIHESAASRREHDLDDLRAALHGLTFPARQDDILAALVVRRAPSRLLWRAGCLSRERLYLSIREVCADLESRPRADRQQVARHPGGH
jgi:hypothetical protein